RFSRDWSSDVCSSDLTSLMKEAVDLMNKAGKKVTVVAPTAQASRGVLREEGFQAATTVAQLLVDKDMQTGLDNQVLWVDEAGLQIGRASGREGDEITG